MNIDFEISNLGNFRFMYKFEFKLLKFLNTLSFILKKKFLANDK